MQWMSFNDFPNSRAPYNDLPVREFQHFRGRSSVEWLHGFPILVLFSKIQHVIIDIIDVFFSHRLHSSGKMDSEANQFTLK